MFIAGYTWHLIKVSPYFQIKDIIPRDGPRVDALSYLKGKNIFSIDLRRESIYISQFFPEYRSVRLFRILPNRLFVDFIKRAPVAVVKLYRYFNLDEEGVLFHQSQQGVPGLPQITGLETKIFGPQPGKKYNIKELSLGLNIIKEIDKNRRLKNYTIKKINIDNPTNATIFMPLPNLNAVLEVRLGAENIKDKVAILSSIILAAKNELANIKYIDLRFKEPVIKMRDAQ
jgi:cell division septal protein FtsQ